MVYKDEITLIADKTTQDADGYRVTEETRSDIFADVKSATRTEFYEALRSGINISKVFSVFAYDYDGQRYVEHNGIRYKVERTYQKDLDHLELNCSEVVRNG